MCSHCLTLDKYSMDASALVLILLQAQRIKELLRVPRLQGRAEPLTSKPGFWWGGFRTLRVLQMALRMVVCLSMKPWGKEHFYSTF